jgi:hypothetical protein
MALVDGDGDRLRHEVGIDLHRRRTATGTRVTRRAKRAADASILTNEPDHRERTRGASYLATVYPASSSVASMVSIETCAGSYRR